MVVWREGTGWQVGGTVNLVLNMVSFMLTSGAGQWYVVGTYFPPNNVQSLHCVEQTLKGELKGLEIFLHGDLNLRLRDPCDKREEELATELAERGLVSMPYHFMP